MLAQAPSIHSGPRNVCRTSVCLSTGLFWEDVH